MLKALRHHPLMITTVGWSMPPSTSSASRELRT
jgi:hypothetical protein